MEQQELPTKQGVLVFSLPEEQNAFDVAVHAIDYAIAWNSLQEEIRQALKYHSDRYTGEQQEIFEQLQRSMYALQIEYNLPELE